MLGSTVPANAERFATFVIPQMKEADSRLCRIHAAELVCGSVPVLESSVLSGPEKIRSRDPWSHIVS